MKPMNHPLNLFTLARSMMIMIFNYMLYIKEDKDVFLQNLQVIIEILHRRTSVPFSANFCRNFSQNITNLEQKTQTNQDCMKFSQQR